MTFLETYEQSVRLGVFAGVFLLMALLEAFFPRKERVLGRGQRWFTNWSIVIIDTLALRVLVPVLAVGMADIAAREGWGLFNLLDWPFVIEVIIAVIVLDLCIYAQHVASHKIPVLWRLHSVHHADRDIDVTTGARFHPVEILLSMGFKIVCVIALGAPAIAVFIFEVLLNAAAMFNHANFNIAQPIDRLLRLVVVTPDMHRVHHSVLQPETDSNYGFCLSWWDRIFRTYVDQPRDGHEGMTIGLEEHQTEKPAQLVWSLSLPFRKRPSRKSLT